MAVQSELSILINVASDFSKVASEIKKQLASLDQTLGKLGSDSKVTQVDRDTSKLGKTIADAGLSAQEAGRRFQGFGRDAQNSLGSLGATVRGVVAQVGLLAAQIGSVYLGVNAFRQITAEGVAFNSAIEDSKLGIASLLTALAEVKDQFGTTLQGAEALNGALGVSEGLVKQLRVAGLETAATTKELIQAFQTGLGSGLSAGLDPTQILKLTTQFSQAAGALQVPQFQLSQEIGSILRGDITMDSRIAKALGLTNEMVKGWKASNTLFEELQKRMEPFAIAGKRIADTWTATKSNIEEAKDSLAGLVTEGYFEKIKKASNDALKGLFDVKNLTAGQDIAGLITALTKGWDSVGDAFAGVIRGSITAVKDLSRWIDKNRDAVTEVGESFSGVLSSVAEIAKEVGGVVVSITRWAVETGALQKVFTAIDRVLSSLAPIIRQAASVATSTLLPIFTEALQVVGEVLTTLKEWATILGLIGPGGSGLGTLLGYFISLKASIAIVTGLFRVLFLTTIVNGARTAGVAILALMGQVTTVGAAVRGLGVLLTGALGGLPGLIASAGAAWLLFKSQASSAKDEVQSIVDETSRLAEQNLQNRVNAAGGDDLTYQRELVQHKIAANQQQQTILQDLLASEETSYLDRVNYEKELKEKIDSGEKLSRALRVLESEHKLSQERIAQESLPTKANFNTDGARRAYERLTVEHGMSLTQAAGVVGNLAQENGAFDPTKVNESGHTGLAQWDKDIRLPALKKFAAERKAAWTDFNVQIDFIVEELRTSEAKAMAALKQAASPEEAAAVFVDKYERSGEKPGDVGYDSRLKNARTIFDSFSKDTMAQIANKPSVQDHKPIDDLKKEYDQEYALAFKFKQDMDTLTKADVEAVGGEESRAALRLKVETKYQEDLKALRLRKGEDARQLNEQLSQDRIDQVLEALRTESNLLEQHYSQGLLSEEEYYSRSRSLLDETHQLRLQKLTTQREQERLLLESQTPDTAGAIQTQQTIAAIDAQIRQEKQAHYDELAARELRFTETSKAYQQALEVYHREHTQLQVQEQLAALTVQEEELRASYEARELDTKEYYERLKQIHAAQGDIRIATARSEETKAKAVLSAQVPGTVAEVQAKTEAEKATAGVAQAQRDKGSVQTADELATKTEGAFTAMSEFAVQGARNMQTALAQFFLNPAAEGFDGLLKNFGNMLLNMAAQLAASAVLEGLFRLTGFGNFATNAGMTIFGATHHDGGIIGTHQKKRVNRLLPGEVPFIGMAGEEVLTTSDPRHIWNLAKKYHTGGIITPFSMPSAPNRTQPVFNPQGSGTANTNNVSVVVNVSGDKASSAVSGSGDSKELGGGIAKAITLVVQKELEKQSRPNGRLRR